jgi:AcrR family transcriptional regulator
VTDAARKPGRPRSAAADGAIFTKTLELLTDEGLRGLSVEKVAEQAGVAKTTIYRRFPTKRDLVRAALASVAGFGQIDPPDTGSIRGDLHELARARVHVLKRTRTQLLMPRLMAEAASDPELHALILTVFANPARDVVIRALRRGVERGELREDVDVELLTDLLAGLTVYRLLRSRGELRGLAARIQAATDVVLDGVATELAECRGRGVPKSP